eukprot:COSAG01_NODE_1543_length_9973_cov_3.152015_6_plen_249_part_00
MTDIPLGFYAFHGRMGDGHVPGGSDELSGAHNCREEAAAVERATRAEGASPVSAPRWWWRPPPPPPPRLPWPGASAAACCRGRGWASAATCARARGRSAPAPPPPQRDAPRHTPRGRGPPTLSPAGTQSVRGGSTPATHSLHVVVGLGGGRTASLKHHCGRNMSSSRNAISAPPWRLSRWRGSLVRWPNLASNHSLHLLQRRPCSFHRRIVLLTRTSSTRRRLAATGHRSRSAPPPSSALYYTHGWRG